MRGFGILALISSFAASYVAAEPAQKYGGPVISVPREMIYLLEKIDKRHSTLYHPDLQEGDQIIDFDNREIVIKLNKVHENNVKITYKMKVENNETKIEYEDYTNTSPCSFKNGEITVATAYGRRRGKNSYTATTKYYYNNGNVTSNYDFEDYRFKFMINQECYAYIYTDLPEIEVTKA